MKLLCLVGGESERVPLMAAITRLEDTLTRWVHSWDEFIDQVASERPDVGVLHYAAIREGGPEGLRAAEWALRALRLPIVIVFEDRDEEDRHQIAIETDFEHFVAAPIDERRLARAITRATGDTAWSGVRDTQPGRVTSDSKRESQQITVVPASFDPALESREKPRFEPLPPPVAEAAAQPDPNEVTPFHESAESFSGTSTAPRYSALIDEVDLAVLEEQAEFEGNDSGLHDEIERIFGQHALSAHADDPDDQTGGLTSPDGFEGPEDSGVEAPPARPEHHTGDARELTSSPDPASSAPGRPVSNSGSSPIAAGVDPGAEQLTTRAIGTPFVPRVEAVPGLSDGPMPRSALVTEPVPVPVPGSERAARPHTPPGGVETAAGAAPEVVLELASLERGEMGAQVLGRVLLAVAMSQRSGEVIFKQGGLERRVWMLDGQLGKLDAAPSGADETRLLSCFTWTTGGYDVYECEVSRARFFPLADVYALILRGIQRHMPTNDLASALGRHFRAYPVVTTHAENLRPLAKDVPALGSVLAALDGQTPLEVIIGRAGAAINETMQFIHFLWLVGGIVFLPEPEARTVRVKFRAQVVVQSTGRRSVTLPPMGQRLANDPRLRSDPPGSAGFETRAPSNPGVPSDPRRASDPIPQPSPVSQDPRRGPTQDDTEAARRAALASLEELVTRVSNPDPYKVFGVSPGCGVEGVERRYYELVREHHPDRYARLADGGAKATADKAFLKLREVQGVLTGLEKARLADAARPAAPASRPPAPATGMRPNVPPPTNPGTPRNATPTQVLPAVGSTGTPGATPRGASVSEALERLRRQGAGPASVTASQPLAQGAGSPPASPPPSMPPSATTTISRSAVGRLSPDQIFRNAQRAIEQGSVEKAWDLLVLSKQKGASGAVIDAHETYLLVTRRKLDSRSARKSIEKNLDDVKEAYNRAAVATLLGHLARAEENDADAMSYYKQATDFDPSNQDANRWFRYLKGKADKSKKPESFLDRLLLGRKSS